MTSRDKVLSYIFRFATEEGLNDLTDFLVENYPIVTECSRLNIPPGGFYAAIEQLETSREQEVTKDVRTLLNYYDQILDVPTTEEGLALCALPEERFKHSTNNVDNFPFQTNILSTTHHPQLPNIMITTTSSKDVSVVYVPTTSINDAATNEAVKPFVIARYTALSAIGLTTLPILLHDPLTQKLALYILVGGIDGSLATLAIHNIPSQLFNGANNEPMQSNLIIEPGAPNPGALPNFITQLQQIQNDDTTRLELVQVSVVKPHQRYLTRIIAPHQTYSPIPASIRIVTGSHDQNIAFIDLNLTAGGASAQVDVVKLHEFKGKVEALCSLPTPTVFQDGSHPVLMHPELVPITTPSRYYSASVRKLHKGNYLDSVEFITKPLPFTRLTEPPAIPQHKNNVPSHLAIVSVRNDPNLFIIDVNTMHVVDRINVNMNGDDHVSFAVLDIAFDPFYGLLYLATDAQTILIMDTLTKQHVRRLYCTDNTDLASPLLRLLPVPSFGLTSKLSDYTDATTAMIKFPSYRNLVAITTANNTVKIYNQHTQQELVEFKTNAKNIKGFVVVPSHDATQSFGLITTGFDKTFAVFF